MRGGAIVLRRRDDDGEISVVDSDGIRYLYFGNDIVQSAVNLNEPGQLVLSYTRAMAVGLLFCRHPRSGLMIGLGGGALVHFINEHFPETDLTVVERRAALIELARGYFLLEPLGRVNLAADEGLHFLMRGDSRFDFILVDAFDETGLSQDVMAGNFVAACKRRLSPSGLIVFNLWRSQVLITEEIITSAEEQFGGHVLVLPLSDKGNLILFAGPSVPHNPHARKLRELAKERESAWGVELRQFLKQLKPYPAPSWWTKALRTLSKNE